MKFIPTPQDYIQEMEYKKWMHNGIDVPDSCKKLYQSDNKSESKQITFNILSKD